MIHPTAIVSKNAKIASTATVGPFSTVGENVELAENVELVSHVCIEGRTLVGKNTKIYPFCIIGYAPQDLKYAGEDSAVVIGENNIIREHVTIHRGTAGGLMKTTIGNNCLLMVGAHVAHDCIVGDYVVMANNATLGGHVVVGDYAILGGLSAVHQFVRVGEHSIVGGVSALVEDLVPYGNAKGRRASLKGLNLVGLKRRDFKNEVINQMRAAYEELFGETKESFELRLQKIEKKYGHIPEVRNITEFIRYNSDRSICMPSWVKS